MQDIWHNCFKPQAKHIAFNTSNFLNYGICVHGQFSKIQSHLIKMYLAEECIYVAIFFACIAILYVTGSDKGWFGCSQ